MTKHHPENERVKRRYRCFLKHAKGRSEASLDQADAAIHRFESYTKYKSFKSFHIEKAKGFKAFLEKELNKASEQRLSKATIYSTLRALKAFFIWLADQPGYRSKISYSDAEYFNLSANDTRIARTSRETNVPTLEQIEHVIRTMPSTTEIERRNRAIMAFVLLTGTRDGALISLKLKHVNLQDRCVFHDASEVKTKFRKTFTTYFFPVAKEIETIVREWVEYLTEELLWGPNDPLFPATEVSNGKHHLFKAIGLARRHWSNAAPVRKTFRSAFEAAGMPYSNPHSFRKTLAQLGERLCKSPEQFKAWSQNLGHEGVLTTFNSYGTVPQTRQAELMKSAANTQPDSDDDRVLDLIQDIIRQRGR